ncbi:MAG: hypothetical protein ACOXZW_04245 [Bacilli bacterium]|jgi:hypothetical protein|nr:hypothetical protein [Bacilli bacterium]
MIGNKMLPKKYSDIDKDLYLAKKQLLNTKIMLGVFSIPVLAEVGSLVLTKKSFFGSFPKGLWLSSGFLVTGSLLVVDNFIRYYNQIKYIEMVKAHLDSDLLPEMMLHRQLKGLSDAERCKVNWQPTMKGLPYIDNWNELPLSTIIKITKNVKGIYNQLFQGPDKMVCKPHPVVKKI